MRFYKSFLFLFFIDFLLIGLVVLFLDIQYLIPAVACIAVLDGLLLFFMSFYLKRKNIFSAFPPDDSYGLSLLFEKLKKEYQVDNVQLLKVNNLSPSFFYFASPQQSFIALSEDILENFSKENIQFLLSYAFHFIKSGDLLFLTLLSSALYFLQRFFYFLNYPLFFVRKRMKKRGSLAVAFVFLLLSGMTRKIFLRGDTFLSSHQNLKENQALFLWRMDSFLKLHSPKISPFMSPLFLTNPLTDSYSECYVPLQPLMEKRMKLLIGSYPP